MTPEYDPQTGKLRLLKYDSDGNGKVDTVSYMDGSRVVRIEIDKDEDGKVDRWEYYGPDQKLEKVGISRSGDGKEDAWSYADAAGTVTRLEISTQRDGKVTRIEHYQQTKLVRGGRRRRRWKDRQVKPTTASACVRRIRHPTPRRPDRRLVYAPDGNARVEVDVGR
jgi:hypothetical protein